MLAAVLTDDTDSDGRMRVELRAIDLPVAAPGAECVVEVVAAAVNRRDHWIRVGLYPGVRPGAVLGADAVGVLRRAPPFMAHMISERVVVNPGLRWGERQDRSDASFRILGMAPEPGTLAQLLAVPHSAVYPCPAHLTDAEAAALPLAGVTAYRALFTKGRLEAGQNVLITGIGGGVAAVAAQLAVAAGAHVFVTSSSDDLIRAAEDTLGCAGGANYGNKEWHRDIQAALDRRAAAGAAPSNRVQLVVDGGGGAQLNGCVRLLDLGGCIVSYGATGGPPRSLDLARLFLKNAELRGTTMGSDAEFAAMLAFVAAHRIRPPVAAVKPFTQRGLAEAFDLLRAGGCMGKIVVDVRCAAAGHADSTAAPTSRL